MDIFPNIGLHFFKQNKAERLLPSFYAFNNSYCVEQCYDMRHCLHVAYIHTSVHMPAKKCHQKQMTGSKNSNFSKCMHIDKVNSCFNFHPKCQWPWHSFQSQWFKLSTLGIGSSCDYLQVPDRAYIAIANTRSRMWPFD